MSLLIDAVNAVVKAPAGSDRLGATSDLSIDEVLLLHSAGWEPTGLTFGVSWWSIPWGTWQGQVGEVHEANQAFSGAFHEAARLMRDETHRLHGSGTVGVEIDLRVRSHHVELALSGTAVRPSRQGAAMSAAFADRGFLSDLSARDFVLLMRAGWVPLDLVAGASFVIAPRRSARQWAAQQGKNTELSHITQALYHAREIAMQQMQQDARDHGAGGVVNVKMREGPLGYSNRVVQFIAMGTAVELGPEGHQRIAPSMVVPLDEQVRLFEATSLRGKAGMRGVRNARGARFGPPGTG